MFKFHNANITMLTDMFRNEGFSLRYVGGVVRDVLCGIKPKDIDLASDATPYEIIDLCAKNNLQVIPTGIKHGTVTVRVDDEFFEITTLREDVNTDGRHAEVQFVRDYVTDAKRRDFTINSMSADVYGNLHDYFGGLKDLKNKHVRFVGDANVRIQEDYLRILRYFRFLVRFPDVIDGDALLAINENYTGLRGISKERIWSEMSRIISSPDETNQIDIMHACHVLETIGLHVTNNDIDNMRKIRKFINDPAVLLAVMTNAKFIDVAKDWKLSNNEEFVGSTAMFVINNSSNSPVDWRKIVVTKKLDINTVISMLNATNRHEVAKVISNGIPVFPVAGKDLMQYGYKQGIELGRKLDILKNIWIESDMKLSKEELLHNM